MNRLVAVCFICQILAVDCSLASESTSGGKSANTVECLPGFAMIAKAQLAAQQSKLSRLLARAEAYGENDKLPGGGGGRIAMGLKSGRFLKTNSINAADLPYTNGIRPIDRTSLSNPRIKEIQDVFQSDTLLVSTTHSGSRGVVRLGSFNGQPVAMKTDVDTAKQGLRVINEGVLAEAKAVKLFSDLGIGPRFRGVFTDQDGRINIVTDVVRGDFTNSKVTTQSFKDLIEIEKRMRLGGIATTTELQLYRTQEGRLLAIDANMKKELSEFDRPLPRAFDHEYVRLLQEADPELGRLQLHAIYVQDPTRYREIVKLLNRIVENDSSVAPYLRHLIWPGH